MEEMKGILFNQADLEAGREIFIKLLSRRKKYGGEYSYFYEFNRTGIEPNKKEVKPIRLNLLILLVPGPGFEPGTHGFSVRCSTD
jgi:hypothetical protein